MPPGFTDPQLAENFNDFFVTKIAKIMTLLHGNIANMPPYSQLDTVQLLPPKLEKFRVLTDDEVARIVRKSPSKCCMSDPVDTGLLKDVLPAALPLLTRLVNSSMQSGIFPDDLKEALVKPLLKKINLDPIDKNYRPVSNLEFSGKLIERAVSDQITKHIADNSLLESMQSAYRAHHSTETALVKVKSDILKAMDRQEIVCLTLLDLSAAFDTISKDKLLTRLEEEFGITNTCLKWIESYLTQRTQRVMVGNSRSDPVTLTYGVPQGSVLGLILFTLYTCPLGRICRKHSIGYHLYADDQQIYLSFKPRITGSQEQCIKRLEDCIAEIRQWMTLNLLKLNDNKTEFILFGTRQQLSKLDTIPVSIAVGNTMVHPVEMVRNLGYIMDKLLKNTAHINKTVSTTYCQIRNIQKIRSKLDIESTRTVVQALVLSRLDYCNSMLQGSADYQLHKLQKIQNMACRVVCNLNKHDHVSDHMEALHWLKICERICFKIATLMHSCIHGSAPKYLIDILPIRHNKRQMRSSTSDILPSVLCKNVLSYNSAFPSIGPRVWNALPAPLRTEKDDKNFRCALKTHLFGHSYGK